MRLLYNITRRQHKIFNKSFLNNKNICCSSFCTNFTTPLKEFKQLGLKSHDDLVEFCATEKGRHEFWSLLARNRLKWDKPFDTVEETDFHKGKISWFLNGKLNASVNCIDRHVDKNPGKKAIIWECDDNNMSESVTYEDLYKNVNRFANLLKDKGVGKGDRVVICLPQTPYVIYAMLACARIGAIHSVVFAGFSASTLCARINDTSPKAVITSDELLRGGKSMNLKEVVDKAISDSTVDVEHVFVAQRTGNKSINYSERDIIVNEVLDSMSPECTPESMDSEDPLFILYTSGSTGQPKGLMHTTAGYLLYAGYTTKQVFDVHPQEDIFGCVADVGWITGHSYVVYGPLLNGSTTVVFESTPTYPDPGRYWDLVNKHKLTHLYLSPTALRLLLKYGNEWPAKYDLSSLRKLGCVGEPLNTEAWEWYDEHIGKGKCDILDTWWQTETGGIVISPRPSNVNDPIVPGMPMRPLPGIEPFLVDPITKQEVKLDPSRLTDSEGFDGVAGALCLRHSWPGMVRSVWGNHQRFIDTYFSFVPGAYFTGDGARQHNEGYYQITGRIDDVINISGHRLGTAEVEDILNESSLVAESAVVGYPHPIKGEAMYVFVTLKDSTGHVQHARLTNELRQLIRHEIAAYAMPDMLQITSSGLPKTRSGKIMRRILRKIAVNEFEDMGDLSTLADPGVVKDLIANHKLILASKK